MIESIECDPNVVLKVSKTGVFAYIFLCMWKKQGKYIYIMIYATRFSLLTCKRFGVKLCCSGSWPQVSDLFACNMGVVVLTNNRNTFINTNTEIKTAYQTNACLCQESKPFICVIRATNNSINEAFTKKIRIIYYPQNTTLRIIFTESYFILPP